MESILPFIPLFFIWFLAAASPGPDFVMIVRNSLISRRTGIFTAIGLGLGITVHVTYCLLGLAFVISQSIVIFNTLKFLAALYLIYIGWKSIRSDGSNLQIDNKKSKEVLSPLKAVQIGFLTNVLNPKEKQPSSSSDSSPLVSPLTCPFCTKLCSDLLWLLAQQHGSLSWHSSFLIAAFVRDSKNFPNGWITVLDKSVQNLE